MKIATLLLTLTFLWHTTWAKTLDGVTLPDQVTVNNTRLQLNGLGTRKATWFKVKVYVGGLYLAQKSHAPQVILKSTTPKFINMHFVRDVSAEKLVRGWNEAFSNALGKQEKSFRPLLDKFNKTMGDIKEGEEIQLTFLTNKVIVKFAQRKPVEIIGPKIARAILSVWFINAADEGLRDGLLAKN